MFYQQKFLFIVYMDEIIFASPSNTEIYQSIMEIGADFDIEDQVTLKNYICVNSESLPDRKIIILQPHLIEQILQDVSLV